MLYLTCLFEGCDNIPTHFINGYASPCRVCVVHADDTSAPSTDACVTQLLDNRHTDMTVNEMLADSCLCSRCGAVPLDGVFRPLMSNGCGCLLTFCRNCIPQNGREYACNYCGDNYMCAGTWEDDVLNYLIGSIVNNGINDHCDHTWWMDE